MEGAAREGKGRRGKIFTIKKPSLKSTNIKIIYNETKEKTIYHMQILTDSVQKHQTNRVFTQVHPTPHIPEQSAEEKDPTWTSKYLKMEPIMMVQICQINDWTNTQVTAYVTCYNSCTCNSLIKIRPHNDGVRLYSAGGGYTLPNLALFLSSSQFL